MLVPSLSPSVLEDISVSMLAHRIVSRFPILETRTVLVQAFMYETQVLSYALDFTTLVLSVNSACNEKSLMQCN